jgi:hypothetical protein
MMAKGGVVVLYLSLGITILMEKGTLLDLG